MFLVEDYIEIEETDYSNQDSNNGDTVFQVQ